VESTCPFSVSRGKASRPAASGKIRKKGPYNDPLHYPLSSSPSHVAP
jgi:hypothetical protein